jgi:hypothetical protein
MKLTIAYQRLEGLAIFIAAVIFYLWLDYKWYWLVIFILAFDVFVAGYLFNKRLGAHIYNIGHSLILPVALVTAAALTHKHLIIGAGLVWLAHIGMDRAVGYGLKEKDGFNHTHLGQIGKK